jgi:tRNA A37 threonylcarbamoyladenosine dehydratase
MVTNKYLTRQSDLIPEAILSTPITVVGAGAIGSFTVLTLAKMGFNNITVFDDDEIDFVNINNQFYRISDIGKKKVDA